MGFVRLRRFEGLCKNDNGGGKLCNVSLVGGGVVYGCLIIVCGGLV